MIALNCELCVRLTCVHLVSGMLLSNVNVSFVANCSFFSKAKKETRIFYKINVDIFISSQEKLSRAFLLTWWHCFSTKLSPNFSFQRLWRVNYVCLYHKAVDGKTAARYNYLFSHSSGKLPAIRIQFNFI